MFNCIYYSFIEVLFNLKLVNKKIILCKNVKNVNSEYLNFLLIFDQKNMSFNKSWFFHYYIYIGDDKNYLILAVDDDYDLTILNNFSNDIEFCKKNILQIIYKDIAWYNMNYNNHSFKWLDQFSVSPFLDQLSGGLISSLPVHWSEFNESGDFEINWAESFQKYNYFLELNNLKNNDESKYIFILNDSF